MHRLDRPRIAAQLKRAKTEAAGGNLRAARRIYEDVLLSDARNAVALFHLGQIRYRLGDVAEAVRDLSKAAAVRPKEAAVWKLYARAVSDLGDDAAVRKFRREVRSARLGRRLRSALAEELGESRGPGSSVEIAAGKVQALINAGQMKEAARLAEQLWKKHRDSVAVANLLAGAQAMAGESEKAERSFRMAQRLDPNHAETRVNFGRYLIRAGRPGEAVGELRKALGINPRMISAMVLIGVACKLMPDAERAMRAFRTALEHDPQNLDAHLELGMLLAANAEPEAALCHLAEAERLGVPKPRLAMPTAWALSEMGRSKEALAILDDAGSDAPRPAEALFLQGRILQSLGRFDDAKPKLREAIRLQPRESRYFRSLLAVEKPKADDPLVTEMKAAFNDSRITASERSGFGFALAAAMEGCGQHGRAFTYLRSANNLMRSVFPFDISTLRKQADELINGFSEVDLDAASVRGGSDFAPVFVTGLPRSGTTLAEQIISSHSKVTGGGELGFGRQTWQCELFNRNGTMRPWDSVSRTRIAEIGQEIERQMRARTGGADRSTDKSVLTWWLAGPVLASLPHARVIMLCRDPRDTLLSMYRNMFPPETHLYSYCLRDLAQIFRIHEEVAGFWRQKLPERVHEVRYESIVSDLEAEAQSLVKACGLQWEEACGEFWKNGRPVSTLSLHQVRQPLYSSSVGAWRRYESDLHDLFEELGGEYAPKD